MVDLVKIQAEHKAWADKNFPGAVFQESCVGMIEEIGELAHVILKRHQGIRSRETSDAMLRDALADIGIYLLHALSTQSIIIPDYWAITDPIPEPDPLEQVIRISMCVAWLAQSKEPSEETSERVWRTLDNLAWHYGWRLDDLIEETWETVKARDWVKYPGNGRDR